LGLGSISIGVESFCIDAVPHLREGYGLSGEGFFESLVEAFEDAIGWGFVGVGLFFVFVDENDDTDSAEMGEVEGKVEGELVVFSEGGGGFDRFHDVLGVGG
jgi:hypothetical protein